MKKLVFFITIICLVSSYANAQRKIEYGFRIGGGLAVQHITNNNIQHPATSNILSNNSIRTFNANVLVNFPVLKKYYLRTSLGIANKGTIITEEGLTTTNKITYLELPINLVRKYDIPSFGKIIGGIGGYVAMGSSGRLDYQTPNSNNSDKVIFGNENDFQKYDAGINLISGLELNNRLTFNLGYDLGLSNIASQALKDTGTKNVYNREFTIMLGLTF